MQKHVEKLVLIALCGAAGALGGGFAMASALLVSLAYLGAQTWMRLQRKKLHTADIRSKLLTLDAMEKSHAGMREDLKKLSDEVSFLKSAAARATPFF